MMDLGGQSLLSRTVSMIRKETTEEEIIIMSGYKSEVIQNEIERINDPKIRMIHNPDYATDQNILTAQLGIAHATEDVLVLEGDCIFNQISMNRFISSIGSNKNIIFSIGQVDMTRTNSIVRVDSENQFGGYQQGPKNNSENYEEWSNMAGAVLFAESTIPGILNWLNEFGNDPRSTYYFAPLIETPELFNTEVVVLPIGAIFLTFNTHFQYLYALKQLSIRLFNDIELIDVEFLKHVEGFSDKRVEWLKNKIIDEEIWNRPICIDRTHGIVMDGQHRMEVAKELGMSVIPAICFEHEDVDFWSLRDSHEVNLELVIEKSLSNNQYPYKTVKYGFPIEIPECAINLEDLL